MTAVPLLVAAQPKPSLPFGQDLAHALERSRVELKPVALVFVAAWCPLCAEMRSRVFADPAISALADEFIWVMVDIDRQLSLAREQHVEAVPLIRVLESDGTVRDSITGLREPEALARRLRNGPGDEPPVADDPPRARLTWKPDGYRGAGVCFSHVGYGPLSIPAQSIFQTLRLGIRPHTPSTLGRGQFEVRVGVSWANFWAVGGEVHNAEQQYFLDFESLQTTLALAYGMTDHFEVEVEFQDRSRFGGNLDGVSRGFHDLFGIDQNGRDEVERGSFTVELDPPGSAPPVELSPADRGSFSRTVQFTLQHNLSCGSRRAPAFSYALDFRVETLDVGDLSGGGNLDVGASVALSRRFARFYVYATLGYAWFGKNRFRGIEIGHTQWTAMVAGEWRFRRRASLLLQWLSSQGLINGFEPFSENSDEITLGVKWELRDRGTLEAGLVENFISFDNTPDVAFHLGYTQRF